MVRDSLEAGITIYKRACEMSKNDTFYLTCDANGGTNVIDIDLVEQYGLSSVVLKGHVHL